MKRKTIEFTIRLEERLYKKIKRIAAESYSSINGYMESVLNERINGVGSNPVVVHSEDGYYIVSPLGYFSRANTHMVKRFLRGSIPPLSEDWEEIFDSFEDAVTTMGTVVCSYSTSGVLVKDADRLIEILTTKVV